jgi:plastocyanin
MKMNHRPILLMLALGLLLAASGSAQHHAMPHMNKVDYDPEPGGGDPNTPAGCAGVQAKIQINSAGTTFSPSSVTIDPGQPVCWTWTATVDQHNIKGNDGSFTSGPPANAGTFQRTFSTPGTFPFHCQVHGTPTSGMRGTVIVRGASGTGAGTIQLASTALTVNENAGALTVTVDRVDGGDGPATVKIQASPGTAKPGKDYNPRAGVLRWESGEMGSKTFDIAIKNDTAGEPDETFSVKLSKATRAALGSATAAVTIHDDDAAGCSSALFAPSKLQAAGQSASEIRLAWDEESSAVETLTIERRQPGGAFREIASLARGAGSFTDSGLSEGTVFHYRIRAQGADGATAYSAIAAAATDGSTAACDDRGKALCLHNGRFEATVEWSEGAGEPRREAKRLALADAPSSGLFSLSPRADLQLLINVRDGCADNDRFWLDFAAVTDAEFTLRVRDTQTGRTWVYFNPAGNAPMPVRDLHAFSTCP